MLVVCDYFCRAACSYTFICKRCAALLGPDNYAVSLQQERYNVVKLGSLTS